MMNDTEYMQLVLQLALKGKGKTSPNPLVGAVIVKNKKIISTGYHQQAGGKHAEIVALDRAGEKAKGSTLYVNLEPCATCGKTSPCTERIIKEKVKKVVISIVDPNPVNKGKGIKRLKAKKIKVVKGVLRREGEEINKAFAKFITQRRPYVILKIAQSLDGRIATFSGDSKWITSPTARQYVHRLRSEMDAILVGVDTIIKDNPLLSARFAPQRLFKHQPAKIILDSFLRIPLTAKVFSRQSPAEVIIATTQSASLPKVKKLEKKGVKVLILKERKSNSENKQIDLKLLMEELAKIDVVNLLIEGGSKVFTSALEDKVIDKMLFFIAPKIIGGVKALSSVGGEGVNKISQALQLSNLKIEKIGEDIMVAAEMGG